MGTLPPCPLAMLDVLNGGYDVLFLPPDPVPAQYAQTPLSPAQATPSQAVPLQDIVVTGVRLPPAAGEGAFAVIRLSESDLAGAQRVDEALTAIPAVSLFRRTSSQAANPTTQGLSLRAIAPSGAGRTLVTLDGVPMNDPFGGWVIWSMVTPESLSGLDVVRGAGAGPYGAGALTGVIQLRERDAGRLAQATLSQRQGQRLAGATAIDLGNGRGLVSGLYETTDGYRPVRGAAAGAADVPLDLDVKSAALRLDWPLADSALSFRTAFVDDRRGSGLAGARSRAQSQLQSITAIGTGHPGQAGWRLQLWRHQSQLANSSVAVSADRQTTTPSNDQYETPAIGWGGNAALRLSGSSALGGPVGQYELELGADARLNDGETRERFRYLGGTFTRGRVAGGKTSVAGAYVDGSFRDGHWLVAGGVRWDAWRNTDGHRSERDLATQALTLDEVDPKASGEVVSARLAVRRDLGAGHAVRSALYSGFRPATLNELHRPFRVGNDLTEANAALRPEVLNGLEAGWSWSGIHSHVTATAFWNRLEDAIVNVTIGQGPGTFPRAGFVPAGGVLRQRQNAGTIEAQGVEVDLRAEPSDRLQLRLSLSGTDARMDGGTSAPQLTGLRPAQAPIWSAYGGLDWQATQRLALHAELHWESRRFDDDLNSRILGSSTTMDVQARWQLTPSVGLTLFADNLLDSQTEVSRTGSGTAGYAPPRTIGLQLRWSTVP